MHLTALANTCRLSESRAAHQRNMKCVYIHPVSKTLAFSLSVCACMLQGRGCPATFGTSDVPNWVPRSFSLVHELRVCGATSVSQLFSGLPPQAFPQSELFSQFLGFHSQGPSSSPGFLPRSCSAGLQAAWSVWPDHSFSGSSWRCHAAWHPYPVCGVSFCCARSSCILKKRFGEIKKISTASLVFRSEFY